MKRVFGLLLVWKIPSTFLRVKLLCHRDSDFPVFLQTSINTLVTFQVFPTLHGGAALFADLTTCLLSLYIPSVWENGESDDLLNVESSWDAPPIST